MVKIPEAEDCWQQQTTTATVSGIRTKLIAHVTASTKPIIFKILPISSPTGYSDFQVPSLESTSRWIDSNTAIDLYTKEWAALFINPFNVWSDSGGLSLLTSPDELNPKWRYDIEGVTSLVKHLRGRTLFSCTLAYAFDTVPKYREYVIASVS